MKIKDKPAFKILLRNKVERFIRQFPLYFYGNILINLILLSAITLLMIFLAETLMPEYIIIISFLLVILSVTLKGFFRNFEILKKIAAGRYKFGIEEFEIDNAIEFIEDFPMAKDEVERAKIALSFEKLIDVFEAAGIISCKVMVCDLDLRFKIDAGEIVSEDSKNIP